VLSNPPAGPATRRPHRVSSEYPGFSRWTWSPLGVTTKHALGGKLPLTWSPTDTIVAISVFPALIDDGSVWTVYLRVAGEHKRSDIATCLRERGGKTSAARATVVELAMSPSI
jgi:hypothetical protein